MQRNAWIKINFDCWINSGDGNITHILKTVNGDGKPIIRVYFAENSYVSLAWESKGTKALVWWLDSNSKDLIALHAAAQND